MPQQFKRKGFSNPLEQAMQTGIIGYVPEAEAPGEAEQIASPTRQQDALLPRQQDNKSTRQQDAASTWQQDNKATSQQDASPTRQQGNKAGKRERISRAGWLPQALYLSPSMRHKLRVYAATTEREIGEIAEEALQQFFDRIGQ